MTWDNAYAHSDPSTIHPINAAFRPSISVSQYNPCTQKPPDPLSSPESGLYLISMSALSTPMVSHQAPFPPLDLAILSFT